MLSTRSATQNQRPAVRGRKLSALSATMLLLSLMIVSGCGSNTSADTTSVSPNDQASLVGAAKKEGSVYVYSTLANNSATALSDKFKAKYGINVRITKADSAPLLQRVLQEAEHNIHDWDIVVPGVSDDLRTMHDKGLLRKLDDVPSYEAWPADDRVEDYGAVAGINLNTILYNADQVSQADAPTSYDDLLKPQFKNNICGGDPTISTSIAWTYMVMAKGATTPDYLTKLGQAGITVAPSFSDCAQRVAAGESKVGIISQSYLKSLKDAGANVKQWVPETVTGSVRAFGVSAKAPHPSAALLFLQFVLSADGQRAMNVDFGVSSPMEGIKGNVEVPAGYDPTDATAASKQAKSILQQLRG